MKLKLISFTNRFNKKTGTFTSYQFNPNDSTSIGSNFMYDLYYDEEADVLWVCTVGSGLNKFDMKTEKFTRYINNPNNPKSLSNNVALCIYKDSRGIIWVATNGGLNKFDTDTETFIRYREKDGLPHDMVYGILEDSEGNLWQVIARYGIIGIEKYVPAFASFVFTLSSKRTSFELDSKRTSFTLAGKVLSFTQKAKTLTFVLT